MICAQYRHVSPGSDLTVAPCPGHPRPWALLLSLLESCCCVWPVVPSAWLASLSPALCAVPRIPGLNVRRLFPLWSALSASPAHCPRRWSPSTCTPSALCRGPFCLCLASCPQFLSLGSKPCPCWSHPLWFPSGVRRTLGTWWAPSDLAFHSQAAEVEAAALG